MKKIFAMLILSVFLINIASAFTFINIFVDETGEAIFLGETDENPALLSGIENNNGEISGFTSSLTNKQGETWDFSYSLSGAEMTLFLPENAVIKEINNGEITVSDNRITIFFQDQIEISYTIEKSNPIETQSINTLVLIILISLLILLVTYLISYTKREKKKEEKKEQEEKLAKARKPRTKAKKQDKLAILQQVLSDREKLIVNKLKEIGKVKSSQLRKLCDIPKASFSRHVQELEKKGLIKRTGEGKNKFVELVRK